jgi:hypothetical protein
MLVTLPYWFSVGAAIWWAYERSPKEAKVSRALGIGVVAWFLLVLVKQNADLPPLSHIALLAIPATALGAFTASRLDSAKSSTAQLVSIGTALLLLTLSAIDYQDGVFRNLTNFSAGGVSLAFSSSGEGLSSGGPEPVVDAQRESAAALPRTQAITYVTNQIRRFAAYIDEDSEVARMSAGLVGYQAARLDPDGEKFKIFAVRWLLPVGSVLHFNQDKHNSEFPSLANASQISYLLRKLYDNSISQAKDELKEQNSILSKLKFSFCKLAVNIEPNDEVLAAIKKDFEQREKTLFRVGNSPELIYPHAGSLGKEQDDLCAGQAFDAPALKDDDSTARSSYLGYLAALTAFAEDAQGNRESAIRLLDERIEEEKKFLSAHHNWAWSDNPDEKFLLTLKQLLVLRLMRWQTTLMQFVAPNSEILKRLAYERYQEYIELSAHVMSNLDPKATTRSAVLISSRPMEACLGPMPWSPWNDQRFFFSLLYSQIVFENNAVFSAATVPLVVSPDQEVNSALTAKIDKLAIEVENANLPCLKYAGALADESARSYFLESVGEWQAAKLHNFNVPPYKGEAQSGCDAISTFGNALSEYKLFEAETDQAPKHFDEFVLESNRSLDKSSMSRVIHELKLWMHRNFHTGELRCSLDP